MDQASALFMLRIINITVIITGLIGNIITFVDYSRPTFRKNTVGLYCRALAISNSFTIYNVVVFFYHILYSYSINTYSDLVCKLNYYIVWGLGSIPGWILIAFAIDKIMSLKKVSPNRMKKSYIHYMIILGIVILNLLVYIELPIYMNLKAFQIRGSTVYSCIQAYFEFGSTVNWIYITEGSIIPFVVMFFSSIYTVKLLRDSSRNVGMLGSQAEKRSSRDKKFAITSLTFNILFIGCQFLFPTDCFFTIFL